MTTKEPDVHTVTLTDEQLELARAIVRRHAEESDFWLRDCTTTEGRNEFQRLRDQALELLAALT